MIGQTDVQDGTGAVIDWAELRAWARRHRVVLGGLALIAAQLIWKGLFLSHFYFRQDDFHILELAMGNSLSWNYLTFVGAGHLIPGVYAITWVAARLSLFNWGLASGMTLLLLAAAGLAALRVLRTLFGDRAAILIPLTIYLLTPLTLPDDSWWSSAIESVPLQIAIFMALNSHVHYVRTGLFRKACAAAAWLAVGLFFFEKALVIPLLLFAVTAGFLMDGPLAASVRRCAMQYWRAWLMYGVLLAGYIALFAVSLRTSSIQPGSPGSLHGTFTFATDLATKTFVPGAVGGPWQWLAAADGAYAYSAPPAELAWLSWIVAVAIVAASIWASRTAWRAWVILAGWIVTADMLPVIIGRLRDLSPALLGLETRYVADAAPVLAICVGLAFWPVVGQRAANSASRARRGLAVSGQVWNATAAGVIGAFVIGSIWSAQAYQNSTSAVPARTYITNARAALMQAPKGTLVLDRMVPQFLMLGIFKQYAYTSAVVGAIGRHELPARLRWIKQPDGTLDHLMAFGQDGRLHEVRVYGRTSVPIYSSHRCWPVRRGRVVVPFTSPTGTGTQALRIGYLASAHAIRQDVTVTYGRDVQLLPIAPGLHSAYLPVHGSTGHIIVTGFAVSDLCIGDVQAGILVPSTVGPAIPPVSHQPS
jgi:hypothetical protein